MSKKNDNTNEDENIEHFDGSIHKKDAEGNMVMSDYIAEGEEIVTSERKEAEDSTDDSSSSDDDSDDDKRGRKSSKK